MKSRQLALEILDGEDDARIARQLRNQRRAHVMVARTAKYETLEATAERLRKDVLPRFRLADPTENAGLDSGVYPSRLLRVREATPRTVR